MKNIEIAIITVTFNDYNNLLRTINSIRKNKKDYQKYYIIDGNSSDNTLKLITENCDIIDKYISEPDMGIYDAMNKVTTLGINEDSFLIWINAGDELLNWDNLINSNLIKYDAAFYSVITKDIPNSGNNIIRKPNILLKYNEKNFFPRSMYMHQGFLIKMKTFNKFKYDLSVGIQAESLLMSQCIINGNYYVSDYPLTIFYLDGISSRENLKVLKSYLKVCKKLNFNLLLTVRFQWKHILKLIIKSIIYKHNSL